MAADWIFECGNNYEVCRPIYIPDDVGNKIHIEAMTETGDTYKILVPPNQHLHLLHHLETWSLPFVEWRMGVNISLENALD